MKAWVKKGAICECYGEGSGALWEVIDVDVKHQSVWLEAFSNTPGTTYMACIGWKGIKGCYRSDKSRRAEKARNKGSAV